MRIPVLLFSLFSALVIPAGSRAQDPGVQQDAEAAREKLLKASDQLDNIQANSETTRVSVDGVKTDVAKLQGDVSRLEGENATLKQQLADLQASFEKSEAAHAKEQKVMVDTVAGMLASGKGSGTGKSPKKKNKETAPAPSVKTTSTDAGAAPAAANPTDNSAANSPLTPPVDPAPAPVKTQKGYYHIVAGGETPTLICSAYRQEGVAVNVSDIQKANGLTDKSVLKVGQKLFIPKPGT